MYELKEIILEQLKYRRQIFKLTFYNLKSEYANHYLGVFWNFIQPFLQLTIYYVVFGLGLRGGGDRIIEGVPFIIHLITGVFPWLFISQAINSGSSAVLSNMGLLSKMKFPSTVFVSISLANKILNLFFMSILILIISLVFNLVPYWHYVYFFYFLFSSIVLIYSISLITSVLVVVVRDTKNLLQNFIRMMFFLTPIFWSAEESNGILRTLVSLNPFSYLIGIFRLAFVHGDKSYYGQVSDHVYFWVFTLTILFTGAVIHNYFKKRLIDYV